MFIVIYLYRINRVVIQEVYQMEDDWDLFEREPYTVVLHSPDIRKCSELHVFDLLHL